MRLNTLCIVMALAVVCVVENRALCDAAETAPAAVISPSAVRMRWMRETTVLAYETAGTRSPKWDDAARRVLEAAARTWGRSPRQNGDENTIVMFSSLDAIHAGCRDPLVMYARARSITRYRAKPPELLKLQEGMAEAFRASSYPGIRKCYGYLKSAQVQVQASPDDQNVHDTAHALVEEAMTLLPEVYADARIPRQELVASLEVIGEVSETVEGNRETLRDRAVEILKKSTQPKAAVLTAEAEIAIRDGLRARGGGFANTVTPEGWRVLRERIAAGRRLLDEAWALDPTDFEVARMQMDVETEDSHGRDEMGKWFTAATRLDPDDPRPYAAKLNWLEPKWHGTTEDVLGFGRECAASERWSALIPLFLVQAHWAISRADGRAHPEYYQDPKVWEEIKPVYDRYLQEPDASNFHKTRYAVIAAYSGHWKEANTLFKSMRSDQRGMEVLYDNAALDAMVKQASIESLKLVKAEHTAHAAAGDFLPNDVVSARWGTGEQWIDVTSTVKEWVSSDDEFVATYGLFNADPAPGKRKHLEITYKSEGKQKTLNVDENAKVPSEKLKAKKTD